MEKLWSCKCFFYRPEKSHHIELSIVMNASALLISSLFAVYLGSVTSIVLRTVFIAVLSTTHETESLSFQCYQIRKYYTFALS